MRISWLLEHIKDNQPNPGDNHLRSGSDNFSDGSSEDARFAKASMATSLENQTPVIFITFLGLHLLNFVKMLRNWGSHVTIQVIDGLIQDLSTKLATNSAELVQGLCLSLANEMIRET